MRCLYSRNNFKQKKHKYHYGFSEFSIEYLFNRCKNYLKPGKIFIENQNLHIFYILMSSIRAAKYFSWSGRNKYLFLKSHNTHNKIYIILCHSRKDHWGFNTVIIIRFFDRNVTKSFGVANFQSRLRVQKFALTLDMPQPHTSGEQERLLLRVYKW